MGGASVVAPRFCPPCKVRNCSLRCWWGRGERRQIKITSITYCTHSHTHPERKANNMKSHATCFLSQFPRSELRLNWSVAYQIRNTRQSLLFLLLRWVWSIATTKAWKENAWPSFSTRMRGKNINKQRKVETSQVKRRRRRSFFTKKKKNTDNNPPPNNLLLRSPLQTHTKQSLSLSL